jgi:uncharacterized phage protein (TIGR02220 family)
MKNEIYEKTIIYFREYYNGLDYPKNFVIFASVKKRLEFLISMGYDFNDFKTVIDYLDNKWKNTEYHKYVRPETVFGDKFENYLRDARKSNPIQRLQSAVDQAKELIDRGMVKFRRRK